MKGGGGIIRDLTQKCLDSSSKAPYWAELWLVNKICYTVWGKIHPLIKILTLFGFGSFLRKTTKKTYRQIIGMSYRSSFHAAESSQMPYTAKIKKINNFTTTEIENPLELRLAWFNPQVVKSAQGLTTFTRIRCLFGRRPGIVRTT